MHLSRLYLYVCNIYLWSVFCLEIYIFLSANQNQLKIESLRFSHAAAQCWKKDDSKLLVPAGKVYLFIYFVFWVEDRVKYVLNLSHGIR